jgi:hypothetical protein
MDEETVGFNVTEGGAPNLSAEGAEAASPNPDLVLEPVVAPNLWTAQEAAAMISAVYNVGVLVWGPEWASHPLEFRASGTMLAPQLDMWMPKSAGGNYATLGIGLLAVAGELAGATARRWPLLKRGPQPLWTPREMPATPAGSGATQSVEQTGDTSTGPTGAAGYRLPKELLTVVRPSDNGALSGLGL